MGSSRDGPTLVAGVCLLALAVMSTYMGAEATLTADFYDESCPQIFDIVKAEIQKAVANETRMAASLVRLHFHDCFVNGCDGSVLLDNTTDLPSEQFAPANNNSARGFEVIDVIKAALEEACPQTVSCADILAIASRDSAVEVGFVPEYDVLFGRRDSLTAATIDTVNEFLPSPRFNFSELKENFEKVGLDEVDLVALSGAHTIGKVKCPIVRLFLSNNESTSPEFRDFLNTTICPPETENDTSVFTDLDLGTPDTFDSNYYKNLQNLEGMIRSDQTLFSTPGTNVDLVREFAENQTNFFNQFVLSTIKMGNISPLEGDAGEIRVNCNRANPVTWKSRLASRTPSDPDAHVVPSSGTS